MKKGKYLVWFNEVGRKDVGKVGGKGANLGEMLSAGFPVPFGFVVTAQAYFYLIKENDLEKQIKSFVDVINFENARELHDGSAAIRRIIKNADVPKDLISEIHHYYHHLARAESDHYRRSKTDQLLKHLKSTYDSPLVAVRSSATAEDLPDASFAGQQETFLNVKGENHLMDKIKESWASLFTERAMYYRHHQKFDHLQVGLASVVQRMVQSEKSGIAFSLDPISNDKDVITIEAIYGLGEYIVGGVVTPDHYEVEKGSYEIKAKEIKKQKVKLIKKGTDNKEVKVSAESGKKQKLSDEAIVELAKIVANIEKHYDFPQDIEWAVEDKNIFIVQSRPITTIDEAASAIKASKGSTATKGKEVLVKGSPASPGLAAGKPVIIMSPDDIDKIKKGDVLVAPMTDPDYVPAMKKAAAIVTELGGRTSHAAIVSRELGVPAVVGAENATEILKKVDGVTVNGETGEIFEGLAKIEHKKEKKEKSASKNYHTLTKIYVNLAQVDEAKKVSEMHCDGIGLFRAEFMMANIGVHPKKALEQGKRAEFTKKIERSLEKVVKPFAPRPVIYRATDFKSNEYKNLKGGSEYEPDEENPMLGFRGASRYIEWKDVFDMEIEAIKNVREKGYRNLHLMIPFVRTPLELMEIKTILEEHGLTDSPSFKLWIMVEVPSTVILLEEFIKVGIDGISIGTNDLTMLIMGVDRDNSRVAHLYSEENPAVMWALERIVKTARKHNVTVSVCGQAPSDYPDLAESLVKWGATSLSLNPDAIDRTRLLVHTLEKKLWEKSKK